MTASKRPIKLDEWDISFDEYKELSYFCRQYTRKKAESAALLTLRVSTPQPVIDGQGRAEFMPHGSGGVSDPVAAAAEKRERLLRDVRMIERAAKLAGAEMAPYILRAVTTRDGVQRVLMDCPCGKNQFYAMRRRFFYILRELKNGDEGADET